MHFATIAVSIAVALASTSRSVSASRCIITPFEKCGSDQGWICCPNGQYCQPWSSNYYQCRNKQPQCGDYSTDIDFVGDDLLTVYGIQPDECCAKRASTNGCVAYTFVNANPGSPACYLKKGMGTRQIRIGAMSAVVNRPGPPPTGQPAPPSGPCATPMFGFCGNNNGVMCCPGGQYCQPWSSSFYQCTPVPSKCSKQLTNVDLVGKNIKAVYGLQPEACCNECVKTNGCRAFTFVNSNPGSPACYLKSGEGEHRSMVGAVSGVVN